MSRSSKPRILLFNPATWRGVGDATAPWGLLSLAAACSGSFDVLLLDQRFDRDWKELTRKAVASGNTVLAGTTGMTGLQLEGALTFLKLVRSVGDTPTVMGGVHASMLPTETVAHPAIDFVVCGEGEHVLPALARLLADRKTPADSWHPAIVWKGRGASDYAIVADLDTLPEQMVESEYLKRYIGPSPYGPMLSIVTSRGCPHGCAFCIHSNPALPSRWRGLPPEPTVSLMTRLHRSHLVQHFHVQDDNFLVDARRVESIVDQLLAVGPRFTWTIGGGHVRHLVRYDDEFFAALRRSGCTRLLIGAESASANVLERIGKKQTPEQVLEVNRKLARAGIRPIYSFISGIPGETDGDLRQTVAMMDRLRSEAREADVGTIKPLVFYPGTRLYAWALANGFVPPATVEGWSGVTWDNYLDLPYPWLTPRRKRFLLDLYYTSLLWNPSYHWVRSPLFSAGARVLMPVTRARMKSLDFRLSLMPALLRRIQHRTLRWKQ
jgi:radical SAM superfamily enzyme YgiQ (UPF0313 family)